MTSSSMTSCAIVRSWVVDYSADTYDCTYVGLHPGLSPTSHFHSRLAFSFPIVIWPHRSYANREWIFWFRSYQISFLTTISSQL